MFKTRQDELGKVFLRFHIPAVPLAVISVVLLDLSGWVVVPAFVGLWAAWFAGLVLMYLLSLFAVSLTVNMKKPVEENHPGYRKTVLYVLGILCRVARLRVHLMGEENIPAGRFLLVSNHRSNYDPIATGWALRRHDIAFVTKPENLKIPLAGPMIYKANYLPIDRSDPRKAMTTINAAAELMAKDYVSVGIYPEGTRSKDMEMLPFHNGVFKIAQKAGVPIVVVSITGTENIHKNVPWRHTDVDVRVCTVLPAEEVKKSSGAVLGTKIRTILEKALSPVADEAS